MRVVFIGASQLSSNCAKLMLENDFEVVIVEKDKEKIEDWSEQLDCGFIHGDGTKPSVLKEVDAKNTHCIVFLSDSDTDNILGSVVATSMGFKKTILRIEDADLESVCEQLGLKHVIFPDRQIALNLLSIAKNDK